MNISNTEYYFLDIRK